ncbi:MAG: hypothetical protein ACR2PF_06995, partial [Rhizobiaceae bacterium]
NSTMLYGKLGVTKSFFGNESYKTSISVDYYFGNDINVNDSETKSVGIALIQDFGQHFQLYGLYRTQRYDDGFGEYSTGKGLFVGARLRFRFNVLDPSI